MPGTGAALLGNLRRVDALLCVVDGFSAGADPSRDLETLPLELLVADRDHVERRLGAVRTQAKSGDPRLSAEATALEALLAHLDAGGSLDDYAGDLPASPRAADDEAAARDRERPGGHRSRDRGSSSRSWMTRRRRRSGTGFGSGEVAAGCATLST